MAPFAVDTSASSNNTDLDRRGGDGIALIDVQVSREGQSYITYAWSSQRRSPDKFTVWLRNVVTKKYYKAVETVWTSAGTGVAPLDSLYHRDGKYQLVLTKHNRYRTVYAKSSPFLIYRTDF